MCWVLHDLRLQKCYELRDRIADLEFELASMRRAAASRPPPEPQSESESVSRQQHQLELQQLQTALHAQHQQQARDLQAAAARQLDDLQRRCAQQLAAAARQHESDRQRAVANAQRTHADEHSQNVRTIETLRAELELVRTELALVNAALETAAAATADARDGSAVAPTLGNSVGLSSAVPRVATADAIVQTAAPRATSVGTQATASQPDASTLSAASASLSSSSISTTITAAVECAACAERQSSPVSTAHASTATETSSMDMFGASRQSLESDPNAAASAAASSVSAAPTALLKRAREECRQLKELNDRCVGGWRKHARVDFLLWHVELAFCSFYYLFISSVPRRSLVASHTGLRHECDSLRQRCALLDHAAAAMSQLSSSASVSSHSHTHSHVPSSTSRFDARPLSQPRAHHEHDSHLNTDRIADGYAHAHANVPPASFQFEQQQQQQQQHDQYQHAAVDFSASPTAPHRRPSSFGMLHDGISFVLFPLFLTKSSLFSRATGYFSLCFFCADVSVSTSFAFPLELTMPAAAMASVPRLADDDELVSAVRGHTAPNVDSNPVESNRSLPSTPPRRIRRDGATTTTVVNKADELAVTASSSSSSYLLSPPSPSSSFPSASSHTDRNQGRRHDPSSDRQSALQSIIATAAALSRSVDAGRPSSSGNAHIDPRLVAHAHGSSRIADADADAEAAHRAVGGAAYDRFSSLRRSLQSLRTAAPSASASAPPSASNSAASTPHKRR
jgi:hypothetical protein